MHSIILYVCDDLRLMVCIALLRCEISNRLRCSIPVCVCVFCSIFHHFIYYVDNESSPPIVVANENGGHVSVRPG